MTPSSDWKTGKFFEWCTQLPFDKHPRDSPTFLIQSTECYFHFCRNCDPRCHTRKDYYGYELQLKSKNKNCPLNSFSLTIYSDHPTPGSFTRIDANFFTSNNYIYSFRESAISDRGSAFSDGYFVKFCFIFPKEDEPLLSLEKKIDEKSTQADLIFSTQVDEEHLSFDFGELLKRGDHTDVQLLCNGGNIPAHRTILAARSKTFSDMLLESTEESQRGLINLTTTGKSIMELCLEFIYKGKILNLPIDKASDLYVLGHVLKISSLKKLCADLMISNLCDDNYICNLALADKYDDDYFTCGVTEYISDHIYLLKSESWMNFSGEHMKTANMIFQKCMLNLI